MDVEPCVHRLVTILGKDRRWTVYVTWTDFDPSLRGKRYEWWVVSHPSTGRVSTFGGTDLCHSRTGHPHKSLGPFTVVVTGPTRNGTLCRLVCDDWVGWVTHRIGPGTSFSLPLTSLFLELGYRWGVSPVVVRTPSPFSPLRPTPNPMVPRLSSLDPRPVPSVGFLRTLGPSFGNWVRGNSYCNCSLQCFIFKFLF